MKSFIALLISFSIGTLAYSTYPTLILKNQFGEQSNNTVLGGNLVGLSGTQISANTIVSNITGSTALPIANSYSAVSSKMLPTMLLTGWTPGAGTVAGTDTVIAGLQKIDGNTQSKAVIANVLTGFTSGAGTISASDTVLQGIQKLSGDLQNKTVLTNVLTGLSAGTGTISSADTVLSAFNKVAGNVAAHQNDSTATDVAGLVSDFNALLSKLQAAHLMQ
jgi:hypothetical protein